MSETGTPVEGKGVSLVTAAIIVLVTIILVGVIGFALGNNVFWKVDTRTTLERDLEIALSSVKEKPNDAALRIKLGDLYAKQEKYDLALNEFENALKIAPKNYDAKFKIATLKAQTGNYVEAEKMLKDILKKYPRFTEGYKLMAYILEKQGKYREAVNNYSIVARITVPKDVRVFYQMGQLYEKLGDKASAKKSYKDALRYSPTFSDAKKALEKLGS